jgi:putative acetyltransferase
MMAGGIVIAPETARQDAVIRLLEEADAYYVTLYPPESNHLLDVETLCGPDIRFFVARDGGEVAGYGALRVDPEGYGEVKRMYVRPGWRGQGLSRRLLARIEEEAEALGLTLVRLETGIRQPAALALYESAGYAYCDPFGDYRPDPLSVFMEKRLSGQGRDATGMAASIEKR